MFHNNTNFILHQRATVTVINPPPPPFSSLRFSSLLFANFWWKRSKKKKIEINKRPLVGFVWPGLAFLSLYACVLHRSLFPYCVGPGATQQTLGARGFLLLLLDRFLCCCNQMSPLLCHPPLLWPIRVWNINRVFLTWKLVAVGTTTTTKKNDPFSFSL